MRTAPKALQLPNQNALTDNNGLIAREWNEYFSETQDSLNNLGKETYFKLVNNQSTDADIDGLSFDSRRESQATIDYLIQRVTDSVELIESGIMIAVFRPTLAAWDIFDLGTPGPDNGGVTFSITAGGQVQYTSTNVAGTEAISKITFRARTLAAKSSLYSKAGR
jgi:hypothetical protein